MDSSSGFTPGSVLHTWLCLAHLALCCMLLLGFVGDVLDLPWHHRGALPSCHGCLPSAHDLIRSPSGPPPCSFLRSSARCLVGQTVTVAASMASSVWLNFMERLGTAIVFFSLRFVVPLLCTTLGLLHNNRLFCSNYSSMIYFIILIFLIAILYIAFHIFLLAF
uniref:UDP-N-acetylglucosamine--dolichyl-phosphate N-acetylglucosaminephosphotransferase-like n=1 Tax=Myxine glutinosa TaxID=7769 RepID=UPI00358FF89B